MVRNLSVTVLLVCGFAAPRADASNGEGFFSISISDDSAFLNVTAVDSNTLLPLPDTFTANEAGEYFLEGLVILDGDTANPIGDFQIIGQGDPELETTFRITTEDVNDPFGILLFASMVVGIKIQDAGLNRQY